MSSMKINPKISIVMPMYGVEKYIASAIKSVLNQDFQDWELLIVNDGSPDNSRMIASSFAACDTRIKILDKDNGGLSDARNFGLNRANGEFVHFFDSDDWVESDFYSQLLSCVDDCDLVVCGYKVDNENSYIERECFRGDLISVVNNNLHSLVTQFLNFAWNKLFRRSFLVDNNLLYEKGLYRIEDSEFMSRFLMFAPKVNLITYSGYHYMVRNTGTLSNIFDEKIFEHMERSMRIHQQVFSILSTDTSNIRHELGKMSLSVVKSILYKIPLSIPLYNLPKSQQLIDRIVNNSVICQPLIDFVPDRGVDKFILRLVKRKRRLLLLLIAHLKK